MKVPVLNLKQFLPSVPLQGIYVNSFSKHIKTNKELIHHPHSHDFYVGVLFTEGTGTHEIDFKSYEIQPGKVFFLKPGQTHAWKFKTSPQGYIFFHTKEFYEIKFLDHQLEAFPFFYSYQNPPYIDVLKEARNKMTQSFENLYEEYSNDQLFKGIKLVNLIQQIYIDLTRMYSIELGDKKRLSLSYLTILEQLETLINHHFLQEKSPQFYAHKLNISSKHLNRVVRATVNKTTSTLIMDRSMLEAKRRMVHTHDSLSHIAYALAFSDYAYFSKVFKIKTGMSPLQFRKKYKNR